MTDINAASAEILLCGASLWWRWFTPHLGLQSADGTSSFYSSSSGRMLFHHHAEIRLIILPRKSNLRYKRAENDLLRGTVFYKQPHLGTQEHIYCRATH